MYFLYRKYTLTVYLLTYYTLLTVYYDIHWCSNIRYDHAPDTNRAKKLWKELVVCGDARSNCEISSSVMSLLTYNCQTWEDRRVSPWGSPPGAWGTQHGWSTWGCSQTLMLTAAFADTNHRVCFEILPGFFTSRVTLKLPRVHIRLNWMEDRHS